MDNHHLIGKSEIGTRSAVKYSTRVIAKDRSQLAAQQRQAGKDTRNCQEKVKKISHLKPNQLAPSIYFMKEPCFFSLD